MCRGFVGSMRRTWMLAKKGLVLLVPSVLSALSPESQSCPFAFPPLAVSLSLMVFPVRFGPGSSWLCLFQVLALFSVSSVVSFCLIFLVLVSCCV